MYGYAEKILWVNLTTGDISTINTSDYLEWGGGHGFGSAIFWDRIEDITMDAYDPRNIVSLMTGPLSGTIAPSIGPRTEVQGISPYAFSPEEDKPVQWFSRSGFGGRWATMLKNAGWNGVAVTGKASSPVWINIINDNVTIEDAEGIWGLTTWEAQQEIWRRVKGNPKALNEQWFKLGDGYTTQNPAVTTCGPAGENLARNGSLVHDGGYGAGWNGFGGVFGSKNLKAISVWGSGSVEVADPQGLMDQRMWIREFHTYDVDNPPGPQSSRPSGGYQWEHNRTVGCENCMRVCVGRTYSTWGKIDGRCHESYWYSDANSHEEQCKATDLLQMMGINATDISGKKNQRYLLNLYRLGILGNGPEFEVNADPVPMDQYGTLLWARALMEAIATRTSGFGDDLAEGVVRASYRWGRSAGDLDSGLIASPAWGGMQHWTLPDVSWAYGHLMGERDKNTHTFGFSGQIPLERNLELWTDHMLPSGDPFMLDYSWGELGNGIYSEGCAKRVAWDRHYGIFWMQSAGACCFRMFNQANTLAPDFEGFSPQNELVSWNTVTGQNMTWEQSLEIGRKITNLDRSINVLRGREAVNEHFSGYFYRDRGERTSDEATGTQFPWYDYSTSTWNRQRMREMYLNRDGVDAWKAHYYAVEGWNPTNGWPTRATLGSLGLGNVADTLAAANKLG